MLHNYNLTKRQQKINKNEKKKEKSNSGIFENKKN